MVRAWYIQCNRADQELPAKLEPSEFIPLDRLRKLGITWFFNPSFYHDEEPYRRLRKNESNPAHQNEREIPSDRSELYYAKYRVFCAEHDDSEEEILHIDGGFGYLDFEDPDENWIRIEISSGDIIASPRDT